MEGLVYKMIKISDKLKQCFIDRKRYETDVQFSLYVSDDKLIFELKSLWNGRWIYLVKYIL